MPIFIDVTIWPLTVIMIYVTAKRFSSLAPGEAEMLSGLGVITLLFSVAFLLVLVDSQGLSMFDEWLSLTLWLLGILNIVGILLFGKAFRKATGPTEAYGPLSWNEKCCLGIATIFCCGLVGFQVWVSILNPVQSWDGLDFWLKWARYLLIFDLEQAPIAGILRAENQPFPLEHPRHPLNMVYLYAYSGWIGSKPPSGTTGWVFVNLIFTSSLSLILFGFSRSLGFNKACSLGICILPLGLPLIENHAILVGYADIWVAGFVMMAISCIVFGLITDANRWLYLGLLLSAAPFALKNIGFLYTAAILLSFFYCVLLLSLGTLGLAFIALMLACVGGWAFYKGLDINILGFQIAVHLRDNAYVAAAGYKMAFEWSSATKLIDSFFRAFFVNSSFSTTCICTVIAILLQAPASPDNSPYKKRLAQTFLAVCPIVILAGLLMPQVNSVYADRFAVPGSDLGNSRFHLSFASAGLLYVIASIAALQKPPPSAKPLIIS